jgi:hypothetical protein
LSGGSFEYVCFDVEEAGRALSGNAREQLNRMEQYLREIQKHDAADELLLYIRELETHSRRIEVIGKRIAPLVQATEWTASGDNGPEAIDRAYRALMGLEVDHATE